MFTRGPTWPKEDPGEFMRASDSETDIWKTSVIGGESNYASLRHTSAHAVLKQSFIHPHN